MNVWNVEENERTVDREVSGSMGDLEGSRAVRWMG